MSSLFLRDSCTLDARCLLKRCNRSDLLQWFTVTKIILQFSGEKILGMTWLWWHMFAQPQVGYMLNVMGSDMLSLKPSSTFEVTWEWLLDSNGSYYWLVENPFSQFNGHLRKCHGSFLCKWCAPKLMLLLFFRFLRAITCWIPALSALSYGKNASEMALALSRVNNGSLVQQPKAPYYTFWSS